ncbi:hypothetical protein CSKR_102635 [Clonorchis sinensis]|uniref:Uncharacterized protein n=1 Tax=Clonorchis sinensis TaxID=79923 RepID=A0A3R7FR60_CLOSI|nr:hypothetical protein CSKR_102635 [Clonorchis sinensis]
MYSFNASSNTARNEQDIASNFSANMREAASEATAHRLFNKTASTSQAHITRWKLRASSGYSEILFYVCHIGLGLVQPLLQTLAQASWMETKNNNAPLHRLAAISLQRLQPGAIGILRPSSWKTSSAHSAKMFYSLSHIPLTAQGMATSLFLPSSWAQKTALSLANDGSAYAKHDVTNSNSGTGYIFQYNLRLTTKNSLFNCFVTDSPAPTHRSYDSEATVVKHLKILVPLFERAKSCSHTTK